VVDPFGSQNALLKVTHCRVAQNSIDLRHADIDFIAGRPRVVGWNTGIVG
jgi:hypothetical protein